MVALDDLGPSGTKTDGRCVKLKPHLSRSLDQLLKNDKKNLYFEPQNDLKPQTHRAKIPSSRNINCSNSFLNLKVLIGRYALISLNSLSWTKSIYSMSTMEASVELKDHLLNHLSDLLQTHESYQIQWESRLNNAVAACAKGFWNSIVNVDFQIMRLKIEIYDELAWNIRWLNESVIFWDQSWTSLDYWRIFEDSVRVEVQSRF